MEPLHFAYWLRGWSEINGGSPPTPTQWSIINDHLDLVFNKVTPDRQPHSAPPAGRAQTTSTLAPNIPVSGQLPNAPKPTISTSAGLTYFSGLSGWTEYETSMNRDKVFITVAPQPIYDPKASYSFYQYNPINWQKPELADPLIRGLLTGIGIQPVSDKVYLVVDNALQPTKPTYAYNMRGSSDHLTMLPDKGPGIINVGVGSPLIC